MEGVEVEGEAISYVKEIVAWINDGIRRGVIK